VLLVGRARVLLAILAAALMCAGGASAASGWTEVTITASDSTQLACASGVLTPTTGTVSSSCSRGRAAEVAALQATRMSFTS
jgi:hypothetical protein